MILLFGLFYALLCRASLENIHGITVSPEEGEYTDLREFILEFPEIVEYTGGESLAPYLILPSGEHRKLKVSTEGYSYKSLSVYSDKEFTEPGAYQLVLPDGSFRVAMSWFIMETTFRFSVTDPNSITAIGADLGKDACFTLSGMPLQQAAKGIAVTRSGRKIIFRR